MLEALRTSSDSAADLGSNEWIQFWLDEAGRAPDGPARARGGVWCDENAAPAPFVPRPERWGGYRGAPASGEFWRGRADRLHDRLRYTRRAEGEGWLVERLAP